MKRLVNKQALYDYQIQEKLEAGIVLSGSEVKSIKNGRGNMKGSFVQSKDGQLLLTNMHIPAYQAGQATAHDPDRSRILLVKAKEKDRLMGLGKAQGLTIVPVSFYTKGGFVKVELGIARGKSKADKRQVLKRRDTNREIKRKLRQKI